MPFFRLDKYGFLMPQYVQNGLLGIGSAAGAAAGASEPMAFTNGAHYGLHFTLILAVLGFVIAWTLPKGKRAKN